MTTEYRGKQLCVCESFTYYFARLLLRYLLGVILGEDREREGEFGITRYTSPVADEDEEQLEICFAVGGQISIIILENCFALSTNGKCTFNLWPSSSTNYIHISNKIFAIMFIVVLFILAPTCEQFKMSTNSKMNKLV